MTELTCGTCKNWHKQPPDPANLGKAFGACTESPPSVAAIQVRPGQLILQAHYPTLPPEFQACSRHQVRIGGVAVDG